MGLWLEHRDESGKLISSARFSCGAVQLAESTLFTIEQARQLCRFSSHLPLEKRDWVLRIMDDIE